MITNRLPRLLSVVTVSAVLTWPAAGSRSRAQTAMPPAN